MPDYKSALAAIKKYSDIGIESGRQRTQSVLSRDWDILSEKQDINRQIEENKRSMEKTKRRMNWGKLIGTTVGVLTGNPVIGTAVSYGAQEIAQRAGESPEKLESGKFFSDIREKYNKDLRDWKRDIELNQFGSALQSGWTSYKGGQFLEKEFGDDMLGGIADRYSGIDEKLKNMYFGL